jgi:hypothetical protein
MTCPKALEPGDVRRVHIGMIHGIGGDLPRSPTKLLHISKILFAT